MVHSQCVSYVHRQKRGIVLLICEYKDTHYINRKELSLTHISRTLSVWGGFPPKPQRGCQFLRSTRTSFIPEFENPKALIPVCYNGCEKARTIWQTRADLTWFTNSVLATSISRRGLALLMYMWVVSDPNQTQTNPNKNQTKEKWIWKIDSDGLKTVSYTHLTLPTKRIV